MCDSVPVEGCTLKCPSGEMHVTDGYLNNLAFLERGNLLLAKYFHINGEKWRQKRVELSQELSDSDFGESMQCTKEIHYAVPSCM